MYEGMMMGSIGVEPLLKGVSGVLMKSDRQNCPSYELGLVINQSEQQFIESI